MTHYTIVVKPLTCKCWTLAHLSDLPEKAQDGQVADVFWSCNRDHAVARCRFLNGLGLQRWLEGAKAWDRFEFRVATVEIADHAEVGPGP